MKDLDFDELDRAVNSLMTDASKKQPDTTQAEGSEKEKTLDITPTLGDGATPSFDKLNEATAKTAGAVSASPADVAKKEAPEPTKPPAGSLPAVPERPTGVSTPPASKRGGRFMDMVHPSADMKKPDAPARVSRQGVTIAPVGATKSAGSEPPKPTLTEPSQPKPSEPKPEEKPTPLAVPTPPPAETHSDVKNDGDWPDPLEMAGFKDEKEENKPKDDAEMPVSTNAVAPKADEVTDTKAPDMSASPASTGTDAVETPGEASKDSSAAAPLVNQDKKEEKDQAPLTSPFLSDAKVEKRPLGGTASTEVEEPGRAPVLGAASEEKKSVNDPAAQLPASPGKLEPELPEELQGDLVAIEADTSTHSHTAPAQPENNMAAPEKKDLEEASKTKEAPALKVPSGHEQDDKQPSGPTSIPQQYHEEASTGDKENGAIYDTDTYHQPLAHPAKKKSSWWVVLWIAIILLLGAGGGAALYLSGIV